MADVNTNTATQTQEQGNGTQTNTTANEMCIRDRSWRKSKRETDTQKYILQVTMLIRLR